MLVLAKDLTAQLGGRWHGRYGMACCPAHGDRNPSLKIAPGHTNLLVHCYAGCDVSDIFRALRALNLETGQSNASPPPPVDQSIHKECENARQRWRSGQAVCSTVAERYLDRRGLSEWSSFARFLPSAVTYENEKRLNLPALILPITMAGSVVAIQRIFLDSETGTKASIHSPKKILGVAGRGSIRLGNILGEHLNLAEGFEDAASAMKIHGLPNCWAVCGIERYTLVSIPDCIRSVTVYSQHGKEAARALEKAMPHLSGSNRKVDIVMPPPGKDWNDYLMDMQQVKQ